MRPPGKRKRAKRKPLPQVPPGRELMDILWRDTASLAHEVFMTLPHCGSDEWATTTGIGTFDRTLQREHVARSALARTDVQSTLFLPRHRAWRREVQLGRKQAGCIANAIVRDIRRDYPKAAPEQVWLVLRDRFRVLVDAWFQSTECAESLALDSEASLC